MSRYHDNAARTATVDHEPTMTDQSQGYETDINVIVGRYGIGQVATGNDPAGGQYIDWTQFPEDLASMIEIARRMEEHRANLPEAIRDLPINEILQLTDDQLTNILNPPAPKPATPPADPPAPETK